MSGPTSRFFDRIVDWLVAAGTEAARVAAAPEAEFETPEEAERASAARAELVAFMSRGLREPLAKVVDCGELLLSEAAGAADTGALADLEEIQRAGRRLLKLMDEMCDLSAIEAGRMELAPQEVAVDELLAAVVERERPAAAAAGLWLRLELGPELGTAAWDAARVSQVVSEVVGNAVKFTREGGVTVTARRVGDRFDGAVVVDVEDTGVGIEPKLLPRIFDMSTVAAEGTGSGDAGLGLPLSRALCRLMGGEISVRSLLGRGSCFKLRLPTARAPAVQDVEPELAAA